MVKTNNSLHYENDDISFIPNLEKKGKLVSITTYHPLRWVYEA